MQIPIYFWEDRHSDFVFEHQMTSSSALLRLEDETEKDDESYIFNTEKLPTSYLTWQAIFLQILDLPEVLTAPPSNTTSPPSDGRRFWFPSTATRRQDFDFVKLSHNFVSSYFDKHIFCKK